MSEAILTEKKQAERAADVLPGLGRILFAAAIIALGIETWVCARYADNSFGPQHKVIPVLPWLPAIPWVAYAFGSLWILFGAGLLFKRTAAMSSTALGSLLFLCAMILDAPKYAAGIGSISLRTTLFEPLTLASFAWLLPGGSVTPKLLSRVSRYLLAVCLIVFGVDHFPILAFIASLIPAWIPWRLFWAAFFGAALVAAGLSIGLNTLQRWSMACLGLVFGIWVVTLHLPRVLGLYAIPGAPHNPNEWSSLFIAVAMWGGSWALAVDSASPR
jgi:uncharacterized membrane protein